VAIFVAFKGIKSLSIETELARKKFHKAEAKFRSEHYDEAIRMFRDICASSRLVDQEIKKAAMLNLGASYRAKSKHLQALRIYDDYIRIYEKNWAVLYNKANTHDAIGEFNLAIQAYQDALHFDQENKLILQNLAQCYIKSGELSKPRLIYENLLASEPHDAEINYGLSEILLRERKYDIGWELYLWRNFRPNQIDPIFNQMYPSLEVYLKAIDGIENVNDYVVVDEQGIGDTIMFSSIIPDLIRKFGKIDFFINSRLISLFRNSFPSLNFEPKDQLLAKLGNRRILLMGDMMRYFRSSAHSFPGDKFLTAPNRGEVWLRDHFSRVREKMIIGVSWRGGTEGNRMAHRSLEFENFIKNLFSGLDVHLVSIQHKLNSIEAKTFGLDIKFFGNDEIFDIGSLSDLIGQLDLVVTVQNTNVHLSGALGKKCFALLPYSPEWRYGNEGSTMPWYNSVELFRQKSSGDWAAVLMDVRNRILIEVDSFQKQKLQASPGLPSINEIRA